MFTEVHQHVDERVSYRAWRAERAGVVTAFPNCAAASERPIDGPREPNGESADTRGESARVGSLSEEMYMIRLHRKVHDPEIGARGRSERAAERGEDACGAQATERSPERHVDGMCRHMMRPGTVRDAGAATGRGFPSRPSAATTPCAWCGEREL